MKFEKGENVSSSLQSIHQRIGQWLDRFPVLQDLERVFPIVEREESSCAREWVSTDKCGDLLQRAFRQCTICVVFCVFA